MITKILDANPFGKLSVKSLHDFEARIGAYIAGEAWFTSASRVILNAGSGRYGDRNPLVTAETFAAAVRMWEGLGYMVTAIPFGQR